ncbi:hypothetical protein [Alkalithermobacter paradoxus]|uniref:Uncharacterized protein n=1 Tax=Alkalithermobacter paradoxus TaxID=29349 RepID=A0A1V4IBA5_9FIRM|nr:hypothetical protein CLOTH_04430 [[Clostridium] thermoalcaliphilum]
MAKIINYAEAKKKIYKMKKKNTKKAYKYSYIILILTLIIISTVVFTSIVNNKSINSDKTYKKIFLETNNTRGITKSYASCCWFKHLILP